MSYINSKKINVFPQANRDTSIQATASLLTEDAIAGIVRRASDESYVISDSFLNNKLEFILGGYYFDVDFSGSDITFPGNYIKAELTVQLNEGSDHIKSADVGESSTAVYQGIEFKTSTTRAQEDSWSGKYSGANDTLIYYMYILFDSQIPKECRRSYNITEVDCGTLE